MESCVFCKIVAGELTSTKIYEDENFLAFRDINPAAPIHDVLIPKAHIISNLGEAGDDQAGMLGKMLMAAKKVAEKEGVSANFSVKTNTGEKSGQSVWHIHFHILGGWKDNRKVTS